MEPQVETALCVTGGRLDFEAIGDALGIGPTSTCRAGELPAAVTRAGLACDMWQHTIARERCMWPLRTSTGYRTPSARGPRGCAPSCRSTWLRSRS